MDMKRIENIRYAEGFIEDTLEDLTGVLTRTKDPSKAEQVTQIINMWSTLSSGVKDLLRENFQLQQKIAQAKIALG